MNKKFMQLFVVVPLAAMLVATNVYQDPGNIFHNDSESIALAILDGEEPYFGSGNGDEKAVMQSLIENMPKHVDCVALGPSISMGIHKELVGTDSFFNLSTSGANFHDYLAQIALLEINKVEVDRIIFCMDSYFFDETFYQYGSRNPDMNKYADYMRAVLNGENPEIPKEMLIEQIALQTKQAFSVTYFQSAVEYIQTNESMVLPNKRWGILEEGEDRAHYRTDGSWAYASNYEDNHEGDVLGNVSWYDYPLHLSKGKHISEESKEVFIQLLDYLQNKGVSVELFLCPLPPALWDKVESDPEADQYYVLDEIEEFAFDISAQYNLKMTGSFDPYMVGVTNADFYDARHIRSDVLGKYFDFTE